MKKLVKSGDGYTVETVGGGAALFDCIKAPVKPFLGEAMTPGDGMISDAVFFIAGAMVGGTVGYKWVKKTQMAYQSFRGLEVEEPAQV